MDGVWAQPVSDGAPGRLGVGDGVLPDCPACPAPSPGEVGGRAPVQRKHRCTRLESPNLTFLEAQLRAACRLCFQWESPDLAHRLELRLHTQPSEFLRWGSWNYMWFRKAAQAAWVLEASFHAQHPGTQQAFTQ